MRKPQSLRKQAGEKLAREVAKSLGFRSRRQIDHVTVDLNLVILCPEVYKYTLTLLGMVSICVYFSSATISRQHSWQNRLWHRTSGYLHIGLYPHDGGWAVNTQPGIQKKCDLILCVILLPGYLLRLFLFSMI